MNRYNLGEELLSQDQKDEYWEYVAENGLSSSGRRFEEYFLVRDKDIGQEKAKEILDDTYGVVEDDDYSIFVPRGSFVTDDTDLASELIRVLNLDFVHDFKSGLFLFDLFGGHEIVMACLYQADKQVGGAYGPMAERYVEEGYGCFKSSVGPWIVIGESEPIPPYLTHLRGRFRRL